MIDRIDIGNRVAGEKALKPDEFVTLSQLVQGSGIEIQKQSNRDLVIQFENNQVIKYQHDGYLNIAGSATAPNAVFEILTGTDFIVPRAGTYKLRMVYFMRFDSPFATNIYVRIGTTSLLSPATITTAWGHAEIKETEIANTSMVHTPIDLSVGNGYLVNITPTGPGWISLELTAHIDVTLAGEIQVETMSSTTEYTFQLKEGSFIDVREV